MAAEVRRSAEGLELTLTGTWDTREFSTLEAQLAGIDVQSTRRVRIDAQPLTALDLSGAWALHQFIARARAAGAEVSFQGAAPEQLRLLDETLQEAEKGLEAGPPPPPPAPSQGPVMALLMHTGRHALHFGSNLEHGLAFLGKASLTALFECRAPEAPAADLHRPPRLRHRDHRAADRFPHRLSHQRHHRLHERPAAARARGRHLRGGSGDDRRIARVGRVAHRHHRGRPLRQCLRR